MLVLTRRIGEEIVIAGNVRLRVLSIDRNQVRIGVVAPSSIPVDRHEVHDRRLRSAPRVPPDVSGHASPTGPVT